MWDPREGLSYGKHYSFRKTAGLRGRIRRAIIIEPLNVMRKLIHKAKAILDGICHHISHYIPGDAVGCCHIAHDLPMTAVHTERYANPFPIPTGILKDIRTPTHVACARHLGADDNVKGLILMLRI